MKYQKQQRQLAELFVQRIKTKKWAGLKSTKTLTTEKFRRNRQRNNSSNRKPCVTKIVFQPHCSAKAYCPIFGLCITGTAWRCGGI